MLLREQVDQLTRQIGNLQRELAEVRQQLDAQGELCECREKRLRDQLDGTYEPCEGMMTKTPKEPCRVMEFHERVTRAAL